MCTVGDLRAAIAGLPDEAEVAVYSGGVESFVDFHYGDYLDFDGEFCYPALVICTEN